MKSRDEANKCPLQNPADTVSRAVTVGRQTRALR